jgi:signal transduction histidine kinase
VSQELPSVPVLPRALASRVTVAAVSQSARAVAAATLAVTLLGVIDLYFRMGFARELAVPLLALGVMLAATIGVMVRGTLVPVILLLVVDGISVYVFVLAVLSAHPEFLPAALILINRPATVVVLLGSTNDKPQSGLLWGLVGFFVGTLAMSIAMAQLGIPIRLGYGPVIVLANYAAVYAGLILAQRAQRVRVPDFLALREETRRLETIHEIEVRAAALLHDTVLNDLALVINGPETLDERAREQLRTDVRTLGSADLLIDSHREPQVFERDATLRNQLTTLVSDFQWRGLTVEVTGDQGGAVKFDPEVIVAAEGALRACLENVLSHSGADVAEIIVSGSETSVTWTVSDAGRGFDANDIASDRLGLRTSVVHRVESVGGTVKIWSAPGSGTSVLITLPLSQRDGGGDE